ncbi:DUF6864 domain-containing function [Klebsiella sp. JB_Kp033]|uniref:DUF6864 domain-containing function n=1 Tax=Klebsiella sp. JB_Kp033 TaxID=3153385 RepID=UPI0032B4935A
MSINQNGIIKEIKIGERTAVESTTILIPPQTTKVELHLDASKKIIIIFSYDHEDKTVRYTGSADESGAIYTMTLINFNNVLGEGIMEPFPFYKSNGIQYYISLLVMTNGDKSRSLIYTIVKD